LQFSLSLLSLHAEVLKKLLLLTQLLLLLTQLLLPLTQLLLLTLPLLLPIQLLHTKFFFIWQAIVEVVPFPRDDFFILLIFSDLHSFPHLMTN
jgi:hypothetical protein